MQTQTFTVQGMSCGACANHVTKALVEVAGVQNATVSLGEKRAVVTFDPDIVTNDQLIAAIEEEGYTAAVAA